MITWRRGTPIQLSKNFTTKEFECPCGCVEQKVAVVLIERLQRLRDVHSIPIRINSGYRCASYQEDLKRRGYETASGISTHELGHAADIASKDISRLFNEAATEFKAIGSARTFIHVDLRDDRIRRWSYK